MASETHPLTSHHLPFFITPPGQTDTLMWITGISLLIIVVLIGVFYFKLHALPEQMSHGRASKIQFEIVAVLALLALFTHTTLYWVAALLLAMVRIPDYEAPLNVMARSLVKIAKGIVAPSDGPPPLPVATGSEPVAAPAVPVVVAAPNAGES